MRIVSGRLGQKGEGDDDGEDSDCSDNDGGDGGNNDVNNNMGGAMGMVRCNSHHCLFSSAYN